MAKFEVKVPDELGLRDNFYDISMEIDREYHFANGEVLSIPNVQWLHVSNSRGHRIIAELDKEMDQCYYVQPTEGWYISWQVKKGDYHFVR